MNVSQPALSRTIRLLEDQLGAKLFDRDTRNVSLTASGTAFYGVVERLLGDFDHAFSEFSRVFSGQRGRVIVGALPSLAARFLPRAIADFRSSHPGVEIVVRDMLAGTIERQFEERKIDLALTVRTLNVDGVAFTPMFSEDFGLVCRADDPLAQERVASWCSFRDRPFIGMPLLSSVRRGVDNGLAKAGVSMRPHIECSSVSTIGGLIEAGVGISALPGSTLPLLVSPRVVWRRLIDPVISRTVGLARPVNCTLSPAVDAFSSHLLEYCATEPVETAQGVA